MPEDYAQFVERLFKSPVEDQPMLSGTLHAAVGISGEAGEIIDTVKKAWVYNQPLDKDNLIEEVGDIMYYIQALCNECGFSLTYCIDQNRDKLLKRYPNGYSDQAAQV